MNEQNEANQTHQLVPTELAVSEQAKPAILAGENEALTAPSPETPHIAIPINPPLQTATIVPREASVPAKVVATPTPQIEETVPDPQRATAPDKAAKARAAIQSKKRKKLERILEEVIAKGSISNNEVEKLLGVSDATASRYLVALQKEEKLKRIGKTGKAVRYEAA